VWGTSSELKAPPLLGEHPAEVRKELLAYSDEQIRALESEGVLSLSG